MKSWKNWQARLAIAVSSIALLISNVGRACAESVYSAALPEELVEMRARSSGAGEYVPRDLPAAPVVSNAREDGRAVLHGLQAAWASVQREAAAMAVTMFFIRAGTPPPKPPGNPGTTSNPPGQTNPPPSGGDPPPPGGSGEPGPSDPGAPPSGTPEPASAILALLGAGLAATCRWRRRQSAA